ncbi:MAG: S-layer homology domain-containing protein [Clostridia bacterium]|nr:S-layer homology domain-containing protein [Clostridia bacterium]
MRGTQTKVLSILLSLAMLCGLTVPTAFAADSRYFDTTDHWAETAINRWSDYNVIEGYGDAFNPDYSITRGQMATILSKTLGLTETAENPFSDISADDWYAPYVLRCYKAGIMLGDNGKANPNNEISRQEAMTMFCRALGIQGDETADLTVFKDSGAVADWALPYVSALVNSGVVSGVSNDMLAPGSYVTRAAIVTMLDRAVVQYINTSGEYDLTDKGGIILVTAGDATLKGKTKADILISQATNGKAVTFKDATIAGAVTVQADTKIINNNSKLPEIDANVEIVKTEEEKKTTKRRGGSSGSSSPVISNLTISEEKVVTSGTYNNVTITDAVADGEVTLSGVTINGDLTIKGGGSSSIKLDACTIQGKVIMAKESGEAPRLELTNTPITAVEVQKPAIIEAVDSASAVTKIEAIADIEIKGENTKIEILAVPETAESAVVVTVTAGNVSTVEVKAETSVTGASNSVDTIVATATVTADSETVQKVEIPENATESVSVTVTGDASVDVEINSTSGAAVTGTNVTVSTTLETAPDNITVGGEAVTHIHKWGEPEIISATCEQEGRKIYSCTADGCVEPVMTKKEVIPVLGHNYGDWKLSDNDLHVRECANDKDHYEKQEHTWDEGKITTEANCGQCGVKTYTCSVCKGTKTESIDQKDHNWGEWVKLDVNNHKRVCKNNAEHTETADHTPIIDAEIEANCTETGKTEGSHCDICNSVIIEQTTVPEKGHDFTGEYEKDADGHWHICERDNCEETDTKAGHTYNTTNCAEVATCTVCNYEKPAGEHTWSDWVKIDDNNHKHTCSCTATETEEHKWDDGKITTEPTETTEGVKTYTCSECKGTKTEAVPVLSTVQITLVQDGDKIKATWTGTDSPNYYFMFADENGTLSGGWWVDGVCEIPDLVTFFPRVDTNSAYSFVLYAATADYNIGEEIARLENCFDITVSGEPMNYEMAFNTPEDGEHTITLGTAIPANVHHLGAWYRNNKLSSMDSGKASYETAVGSTFTRNHSSIQDGDVYDLRLLTTYILEGQTIKAVMTPASKKTYVANNVEITLSQNGTHIVANWTGANCDNGYTWALIEDGDIHQLDFVGKNVSATADFKPCLTRIDSGVHSYDFVLYEYDESSEDCIGKELGRLENAIEVTIAGELVGYTMSFTAPADGQYQITLNAVPTEGNTYLTRWNRGKSNYSSIYVSDGTQTYTETTFMGALQDGDIYDLRLLTTYTLEEQTIKAVMTPPSTTTYKDYATKNIQFSKYNDSIYCISWDGIDATGPSGNYYKVMATQDAGETWELIGTAYYEKKWPLFDENAVSYNGVKVITVVNGEEVAETETLDLSITVLEDADSDSVVAGFTANGENSIQADLSGLTPNTYFYMHLATTLDPLSSQRLYCNTADEQGTCTTTFTNATIIERITSGYYLVKEFRDYNLSADGKAISYTAVTRGDWTKCISE